MTDDFGIADQWRALQEMLPLISKPDQGAHIFLVGGRLCVSIDTAARLLNRTRQRLYAIAKARPEAFRLIGRSNRLRGTMVPLEDVWRYRQSAGYVWASGRDRG